MPDNVLLTIYQGETFNPPPIIYVDNCWNPINLTGYTAIMSAAMYPGADTFAFQATVENGQITIGGDYNNEIFINVPASEIVAQSPFEGKWDLFLYSPQGISTRLIGGRIRILESVTG